MVVRLSPWLQDELTRAGVDATHLQKAFHDWKQDWPANEYRSPHFGKDGLYRQPTVDGRMVLSHVHLEPAKDHDARRRWKRALAKQGKKTSDTILVYAQDMAHGHLLLAIFYEPDGHRMAAMDTPTSRAAMNHLAQVAAEWMATGHIPP
jgi:hypothetical protein